MSFPRPYISDVKQNDTEMHYVRNGDFTETDIGARKSGMPKDISGEGTRMSIKHVGDKAS